jgi:CBS domain-containing protein
MSLSTTFDDSRLTLHASTAADLMTPDPVSISAEATVRDGISLLTDRGFSAAPVIDAAGRPVGVLSRTDLLVHERETIHHVPEVPDYFHRSELTLDSGEKLDWGFHVEGYDDTRVGDVMTPLVFSVRPTAPARRAVEEMVGWRIHRMFVVDEDGVLVGVISALDVLKDLLGN